MPRSEECTTLEREEDRGCSTLLQLRPPHWIVHGLSYFVVVFVLVAFIGAAVVNVADSVECEFTLVARNALGSIRAPQRGIVEQVRGADGATVRRGEILFVIRTDQVLAQSTSRAELESELRALERERVSLDEQLRQELEHYHAEHELLKNELASQRKEEEFRQRELELSTDIVERAAKLKERQVLSVVRYRQLKLEREEAAHKLALSQREIESIQLKLRQLDLRYRGKILALRRDRSGVLSKIERAEIKASGLTTQIGDSADNRLLLRSPVDGVVSKLALQTSGSFVSEGEILAEMLPQEVSLYAELDVPPDGVGLVRRGQGVRLLFDAFPFQRYGVKRATISWISPGRVGSDKKLSFRGHAELQRQTVHVRGDQINLVPGMRGQARIITERRSLLSFAFEPLQFVRENFGEAQST